MMYGHARIALFGVVAVLGLSAQGCSNLKWFHHGSDEQSQRSAGGEQDGKSSDMRAGRSQDSRPDGSGGTNGSEGTDSSYPSLSLEMNPGAATLDPDGGSLSGLSAVDGDRITAEERLSRSRIGTIPQGVDRGEALLAELRREEEAALAAGLHDVFYAYNRWMVQDDGMQALTANAGWLKEHPTARLRISGHCDERGSHDYNLVLGEKRAHAAKNVLVEMGVSPKQVSIVSYGKDRPFCRESDEACYRQNRRGHMLLRVQ